MTDPEKLIQLAAALKALHSERALHDGTTPHATVMHLRHAAKAVRADIATLADKITAEVLAPICKEA